MWSLLLAALLPAPSLTGSATKWLKGTFHQHATQPVRRCHYAPEGVDCCGGPGSGCEHEQDDGGTDADVLLEAIANASRGYDFVGLAGNEEPPMPPLRAHPGLTWLLVTENQMAAVCTKGEGDHGKCKHPCNPAPPNSSGPWLPTVPPVNNIHREYIQGVPGVFVQHPTTDPERDQILQYMTSGQDNLRGLEVYNAWADQAWDAVVPRTDTAIDPLYPTYPSHNCTAWQPYHGDLERYPGLAQPCTRTLGMEYWDRTLCALKRPVYGLADDDGFVYTGYTDQPVSPHGRHDVQTNSPAWWRFGSGWVHVRVPDEHDAGEQAAGVSIAQQISTAVDRGDFYASSGIALKTVPLRLAPGDEPDIIVVEATEPVTWGVTGGAGSEHAADGPLRAFNLTLCVLPNDTKTAGNVGCAPGTRSRAPPRAQRLQLDLRAVSGSAGEGGGAPFFFVRVQALVRTRYPITKVETSKHDWHVTVGRPDGGAPSSVPGEVTDLMEGRLLRATGASRRPLLVPALGRRPNSVEMAFARRAGYFWLQLCYGSLAWCARVCIESNFRWLRAGTDFCQFYSA